MKSDANDSVEDNITNFSKTLISIAEESIPNTSSNKKHNKSWFNDDCKTAIRSRKAALRKINLQPSAENLNSFKIHRAKLVELLNHPRKHLGKITSINLSPPSSRKFLKISGKNTSNTYPKTIIKATNKKDIADLLAKTFSKNSSSTNISKPFHNIKKNAEKSKLKFKSNNLEDYKQPFFLSLN